MGATYLLLRAHDLLRPSVVTGKPWGLGVVPAGGIEPTA